MIWHFNFFFITFKLGLFENGYHDTNPYHNSVHAADVTQAMHCFIEEEKNKPILNSIGKDVLTFSCCCP